MQSRTLTGAGMNGANLITLDTVNSTNTWALEHASSLHDGDVVRADEQTDGHGRFGRTWLSFPGQSVSLTWIAIPSSSTDPLRRWPGQITAAATARLLRGLGISAGLRWPNDVVAGSRKIAGTLAEASSDFHMIAVGIGLNVNVDMDTLSRHGLSNVATSMSIEANTGYDIEIVIPRLISSIGTFAAAVRNEGPDLLLNEWRSLDCMTDREIKISTAGGDFHGICRGVSSEMEVLLAMSDGTLRPFTAGDVTLLRPSARA